MIFDPDAGKSMDEILEETWTRLTPEARIKVEEKAAAEHWTIGETMEWAVLGWLNNPVNRQAFQAQLDFEAQPFGADPLLSKDGN